MFKLKYFLKRVIIILDNEGFKGLKTKINNHIFIKFSNFFNRRFSYYWSLRDGVKLPIEAFGKIKKKKKLL